MRDDIIPHPNGVGDVASSTWKDVCLPTRTDVKQPFLLAKAANAGSKAVILFMGSNGTPITNSQGEGIRLSGNFLVRSSPLFAEEGFITAIVDTPSDKPQGPAGRRDGGMDDAFRQSSIHRKDIEKVVDFLVDEGAHEVFLVGTSRGTLSVAYLATVITHANVRGYVLTASLAECPPAIRSYAPRITDPVLMVHHTGDVCRVTMYDDARAIFETIPASTRKEFISVSGGSTPKGSCCGPMSAHGFLGKERETVQEIIKWMSGETPLEYLNCKKE